MKGCLLGLVLLIAPLAAEAAVPSSFSVQGVLRSSTGALQSMPVTVTVKLYAAQTGGSELATPVMAQSVMASNGLFTLNVAVTPALATVLTANPQLWLELTVNTDVYPRQPLTSNVYALYAGTADVASSLSSTAMVPGNQITGTIDGGQLQAGSVQKTAIASGALTHAHGLTVYKTGENFTTPSGGHMYDTIGTAVTICSPSCGSDIVIGGDCTTNGAPCPTYVKLSEGYTSNNQWCCTAEQLSQPGSLFCNLNTWALCLGANTKNGL